jgi:hypothetical protein
MHNLLSSAYNPYYCHLQVTHLNRFSIYWVIPLLTAWGWLGLRKLNDHLIRQGFRTTSVTRIQNEPWKLGRRVFKLKNSYDSLCHFKTMPTCISFNKFLASRHFMMGLHGHFKNTFDRSCPLCLSRKELATTFSGLQLNILILSWLLCSVMYFLVSVSVQLKKFSRKHLSRWKSTAWDKYCISFWFSILTGLIIRFDPLNSSFTIFASNPCGCEWYWNVTRHHSIENVWWWWSTPVSSGIWWQQVWYWALKSIKSV